MSAFRSLLRAGWCALRGHDWPNWDCEDCFDYWNVGMSCGHRNLWRNCNGCGDIQIIRDELPWIV